MPWQEYQEHLMRLALAEAEKARGRTFPNPAVGAVVALGDKVLGAGFHRKWGLPHAEIEALRRAGGRSRGADLYVTLEPCCHYGKTPPCTDAIVRSGIRRVYASIVDPNPAVRGGGIRALRRAGVEVHVGLERAAATALNEAYLKFMKTGRPFVTLKTGQTLDGKIATRDGQSRWITGPAARNMVRGMRENAQAIVVGVGTVIKDDPRLLPKSARRRAYWRCVLDSRLRIPLSSRVVRTASRHPTIVYCARLSGPRARRLELAGVTVKQVETAPAGVVGLHGVLHDLAAMGVMHVFVEGGSAVFSSFLKAGLVDKMLAFISPKVIGDRAGLGAFGNLDVKALNACYGFTIDSVERVGADLLVKLYPNRSKNCSPE